MPQTELELLSAWNTSLSVPSPLQLASPSKIPQLWASKSAKEVHRYSSKTGWRQRRSQGLCGFRLFRERLSCGGSLQNWKPQNSGHIQSTDCWNFPHLLNVPLREAYLCIWQIEVLERRAGSTGLNGADGLISLPRLSGAPLSLLPPFWSFSTCSASRTWTFVGHVSAKLGWCCISVRLSRKCVQVFWPSLKISDCV